MNFSGLEVSNKDREGIFWCNLCHVGAESAPSGWNRVKVSENVGATAVAPVAPALQIYPL